MRSLLVLALVACTETPAPTVHAFVSGPEGFDTTTWWVDTGAEVVVFDAQFTPELAEEMLAEIEATTASPVRWVVVTHPNPDKFNGATVFQAAGAELVASEATAAAMPGVHAYKEAYFVGAGMFEAGAYPALPEVDIPFGSELALELDGDASIRLEVLDHAGVASTQTVAWVGDDQVVVGDLVASGVHAWLEGGIVDGVATPDLGAWSAALGELDERAPEGATVYPGRGAAAAVSKVVAENQAYLAGMDALVAEHIGALADPVATLSGPEAGEVYGAITADAEARFPELDLSYLVTHGVYGLAWSKVD